MYLKRKAYDALTAWKKKRGHATLEVSGARQVGKTYIVNRFADEQYKKKIYINLLEFSGELFIEQYRELWSEMKAGKKYENPVYELMKRYQTDFEDSEDTIIIIDEIQESADIYYDNIFVSVARILAKEKKGFVEDSFSEELQSIVVKDYSSNISKASIRVGIVNENFVYLDLKQRVVHPSEIAFETPENISFKSCEKGKFGVK